MLVDLYDAALFDLDGVIYLGPHAIPGIPESLAALRTHGTKVGFVTNNAARPAHTVVEHLNELDIECYDSDVVTSGQAGARMLQETMPQGSTILVVGTQALIDEVTAVGMKVVDSCTPTPDAIIQGYDPNMGQPLIDEGCLAVQAGARWFATNTDTTRPTDRGLVPGVGGQIACLGTTIAGFPDETFPEVAGKPYPPLLNETVRRLETTNPIFVGDRIDTDIMGAVAVNMDSLFVFTGAHGIADLLAAGQEGRPTHIGYDISALLEPERTVSLTDTEATCNGKTVLIDSGKLVFDLPQDLSGQLDVLWAGLQLAWANPQVDSSLLGQLDKLH